MWSYAFRKYVVYMVKTSHSGQKVGCHGCDRRTCNRTCETEFAIVFVHCTSVQVGVGSHSLKIVPLEQKLI